MLALDTNVLVRFLVRDDEEQFKRAQSLIRREARDGSPVYISLLVILETEWVLRSRYKLSKDEILESFDALLSASELTIEDEPSLEETLFIWKDSSAQFADCSLGSRHQTLGCSATVTFDKQAAKLPSFVAA